MDYMQKWMVYFMDKSHLEIRMILGVALLTETSIFGPMLEVITVLDVQKTSYDVGSHFWCQAFEFSSPYKYRDDDHCKSMLGIIPMIHMIVS